MTFIIKAILALPAFLGVIILFGCLFCLLPILVPFLAWVTREISLLTMGFIYVIEAVCCLSLWIYYKVDDYDAGDLIFFAFSEILLSIVVVGLYFRLFAGE